MKFIMNDAAKNVFKNKSLQNFEVAVKEVLILLEEVSMDRSISETNLVQCIKTLTSLDSI